MSFSATQALIVNLFIVSRLGFHVPPAALSTGCRSGCALEVAPLRRPTPFFFSSCLQVSSSLYVWPTLLPLTDALNCVWLIVFSCLCWSFWLCDLLLTEEAAATLFELHVAPDNEGVSDGQTWTLCVFFHHRNLCAALFCKKKKKRGEDGNF